MKKPCICRVIGIGTCGAGVAPHITPAGAARQLPIFIPYPLNYPAPGTAVCMLHHNPGRPASVRPCRPENAPPERFLLRTGLHPSPAKNAARLTVFRPKRKITERKTKRTPNSRNSLNVLCTFLGRRNPPVILKYHFTSNPSSSAIQVQSQFRIYLSLITTLKGCRLPGKASARVA